MKTKILTTMSVLLLITVFVSCGKNPLYSRLPAAETSSGGGGGGSSGGKTSATYRTAVAAYSATTSLALAIASDAKLYSIAPSGAGVMDSNGQANWYVEYASRMKLKRYRWEVLTDTKILGPEITDYTLGTAYFDFNWATNSPDWVTDVSLAAKLSTAQQVSVIDFVASNVDAFGEMHTNIVSYYFRVRTNNDKLFYIVLLPEYSIAPIIQ